MKRSIRAGVLVPAFVAAQLWCVEFVHAETGDSSSLQGILAELDKPIATPTPVLKYRCTEQGVKDALSDLIKLSYKMENVQNQLGGKQQRMINDLEKVLKSAGKDPAAAERFAVVEKEALAYADALEHNISSGELEYRAIRPIKEVCSLDTVANNRAAADLNRRLTLVDQTFSKLKLNPQKLRDALGKVRETFNEIPKK